MRAIASRSHDQALYLPHIAWVAFELHLSLLARSLFLLRITLALIHHSAPPLDFLQAPLLPLLPLLL